jgi:hypothetical protein
MKMPFPLITIMIVALWFNQIYVHININININQWRVAFCVLKGAGLHYCQPVAPGSVTGSASKHNHKYICPVGRPAKMILKSEF